MAYIKSPSGFVSIYTFVEELDLATSTWKLIRSDRQVVKPLTIGAIFAGRKDLFNAYAFLARDLPTNPSAEVAEACSTNLRTRLFRTWLNKDELQLRCTDALITGEHLDAIEAFKPLLDLFSEATEFPNRQRVIVAC